MNEGAEEGVDYRYKVISDLAKSSNERVYKALARYHRRPKHDVVGHITDMQDQKIGSILKHKETNKYFFSPGSTAALKKDTQLHDTPENAVKAASKKFPRAKPMNENYANYKVTTSTGTHTVYGPDNKDEMEKHLHGQHGGSGKKIYGTVKSMEKYSGKVADSRDSQSHRSYNEEADQNDEIFESTDTHMLQHDDGHEVKIGDKVKGFRGTYKIKGFQLPTHSGSSGRVLTDKGAFYPSVIDAKIVKRKLKTVKEEQELDEVSAELAQKALDARLQKGIHGPKDRFSAFRSSIRRNPDHNKPDWPYGVANWLPPHQNDRVVPKLADRGKDYDYLRPKSKKSAEELEDDATLYRERPSRKFPVQKPLKEATHLVITRLANSSKPGPQIKVTANNQEEAIEQARDQARKQNLVIDRVVSLREGASEEKQKHSDDMHHALLNWMHDREMQENNPDHPLHKYGFSERAHRHARYRWVTEALQRSTMTAQDQKYMNIAHRLAKDAAINGAPEEQGYASAADKKYMGIAHADARAEIAAHATDAELGIGSEFDKQQMRKAKNLAKSALKPGSTDENEDDRYARNTKAWQDWSKGVKEEVGRALRELSSEHIQKFKDNIK
jgi:hypothetical protein